MQAQKLVKVSPSELHDLIVEFKDIEKVTQLDITGRSLLNRNSDGDYRFSHYSVQEFLVAYFILEIASLNDTRKIYPTDFIKHLLKENAEKINARFREEHVRYQTLIENKGHRSTTTSRQEFLREKEIADLLAEHADQLEDMDITAFGADLDIPAFLRRAMIKHTLPKDK
jgi:hypothetical protein